MSCPKTQFSEPSQVSNPSPSVSSNQCTNHWAGSITVLLHCTILFVSQFTSYPGFFPNEVTPLPGQLEAPQLLNKVTKAQKFPVSQITFCCICLFNVLFASSLKAYQWGGEGGGSKGAPNGVESRGDKMQIILSHKKGIISRVRLTLAMFQGRTGKGSVYPPSLDSSVQVCNQIQDH